MQYESVGNKVLMTEYDSFDIGQILECGQTFRFEKLDEKYYQIIAFGKVLYIKQDNENNVVEFYPCNIEDFEKIWINYFDLNTDYMKIKEILSENDIVLRDAIEFAPGIRILKQEHWEMIISFIISQNNRIPQIKQVIKNISAKYGTLIADTEDCFSFPSIEQLASADIDGLNSCKTGFRSKYIMDAIEKIGSGYIDLDKARALQTEDLKSLLMEIKGIGTKVADCVLLFAFERYEYFPTDVWIKRMMQHFYFDKNETSVKDIHNLAFARFGANAGYAQQYLFHYARQFPEIFSKK